MNTTASSKIVPVLSALLMMAACTSDHKHSAEMLASFTRNACPIDKAKCLISANELDGNGVRTRLSGSYRLQRLEEDSYQLIGSVKLKHDPVTWQNLDSLEINFLFFDDGGLVHEEKIMLAGGVDVFLSFSKSIMIDDDLVSSNWSGYTWKPSE